METEILHWEPSTQVFSGQEEEEDEKEEEEEAVVGRCLFIERAHAQRYQESQCRVSAKLLTRSITPAHSPLAPTTGYSLTTESDRKKPKSLHDSPNKIQHTAMLFHAYIQTSLGMR